MEKSRAIELLEHLAWDRDIERNPYGDALNMAIEALKAQLSECTTKGTPYLKEYATADPDTAIGGLREMGDNLLREIHSRAMSRMGDCISRQAAVDAVHKNYDTILDFKSDGRTVADSFEDIIDALPPAQPEQKWIPCSERLPENRVSVIVCFREWQQYAKRYVYSIVVGWYARKHSVHENVFSDWEADCEYDEIEDEYYIEEGWYEFTTQGNGDLMNWYINADVIAWMPLPEPYKEGGEDFESK